MPHSFPPVIGPQTRILIIGSMPGEASLRAREYYAYRYNQFWRVVFDVFENGRPPNNYADKTHTLLRHGLGLWDALASCKRQGSLDGHILRPVPNDFPGLLTRYPQVHTLLFNGTAAFKFYKQAFGVPDRTHAVLPSTSPAHAARSYAQKLALWRHALTQRPG